MAEKQSMSEFERLLKERTQIEQWLEKLGASGDKTPASVRERVQADYLKRLDEVQEELNGHRDEITGALERHRQVRDELIKQQSEAQERRAEGELRHSVGEFDDTKWESMRSEIDGSLKKIGEELDGVETEVADLEKALASITSSPDVGKTAAEPAKAAGTTDAAVDKPAPKSEDLPPPIRDAAPAAAAATAALEPASKPESESSDEPLEFLDVDAGQKEPELKPSRKSDTVPMPPDAAELLGKKEAARSSGEVAAGAEIGAAGVTSFSNNAEQPKKGVAKTLKCGECGAMNLPTEWYCERCGAELAAL
jgi:ElaB/YqjD/DUF883 family membrane-anchored ribosome-binding protein